MRRFCVLGLLVIGTAAGCGAGLQQLRGRAAYDLSCPEGQLTVVDIDALTKRVTGCGKQGTFVERCTRLPFQGTECTWVLDGGTPQSSGEVTPPPPPAAVSR